MSRPQGFTPATRALIADRAFDFNGRLSTSEWRFSGKATLVRHYDPESSPPRMTFCEIRIDEVIP